MLTAAHLRVAYMKKKIQVSENYDLYFDKTGIK